MRADGSEPNHRLDCLVYALAALALSRLKIDDCDLQRTEARNVGKEPRAKEREQTPKWGVLSHTILGEPSARLTVILAIVSSKSKLITSGANA